MKICSKCKLNKEDKDFSLSKVNKSGLQSWCKECASALTKNEYYKQYHKQYIGIYKDTEHGRNALREGGKRFYRTPKGLIGSLKKRLKDAKTEKTKIELEKRINILENEINRGDK